MTSDTERPRTPPRSLTEVAARFVREYERLSADEPPEAGMWRCSCGQTFDPTAPIVPLDSDEVCAAVERLIDTSSLIRAAGGSYYTVGFAELNELAAVATKEGEGR